MLNNEHRHGCTGVWRRRCGAQAAASWGMSAKDSGAGRSAEVAGGAAVCGGAQGGLGSHTQRGTEEAHTSGQRRTRAREDSGARVSRGGRAAGHVERRWGLGLRKIQRPWMFT